MTESKKEKRGFFNFLSLEGTYSEKMTTAEEVFEETQDIMKEAQSSIYRRTKAKLAEKKEQTN